MSDDIQLEALRSILNSVEWAVGKTIIANGGWRPRPGSQAAREIADQGPFVARTTTPVLDAHSIPLMRLSSATEHFPALARLMQNPAFAFGPASLARTALENSARAWWALDPSLDLRMRIARGRTDVIVNLGSLIRILDAMDRFASDKERIAHEQVLKRTKERLSDIVEDTETIGLQVLRTRKGIPMGVEEQPLGATAVITAQLGDMGKIAYNDLSAVAHGTLFGMASHLEEVGHLPKMDEVKLAAPKPQLSSLTNLIAVTLHAYKLAMKRRMELYGWDMTDWEAWNTESSKLLLPLLRKAENPTADDA